MKVWDAATGQDLRLFKGHTDLLTSVCFSPDGKRLATGTGGENLFKNGEVQLWDAATGQELLTLKGGQYGGVRNVCFSPDGMRLASVSAGSVVQVWDAATGQELLTIDVHPITLVGSVCFSPDGKRLASAKKDGTVQVWDAATGQELLALKGHIGLVWSLCFSADGKRIVSQGEKGKVRSWDASNGQPVVPCLDPPPPPDKQLETVSPNGTRRVFIEGADLRVVDLKDARPLSDLVFLRQLNDVPARLRWHRAEAADSEKKEQWFGAAFHLRQLIAAKEADSAQLKIRLNRCEDALRKP